MGNNTINDINPRLDALMDSGSNTIIVNNNLQYLMHDYIARSEILTLANKSQAYIAGRGTLGIFTKVALVTSLSLPLISTKVLCYKPFFFIILHIDEIAYIIDRYIEPTTGQAVIATASVRSDGLYHVDNLLDLLDYNYQQVPKTNDYSCYLVNLYGKAHVTAYIGEVLNTGVPLTKKEVHGSCQNKNTSCDVGIEPLALTHIKFGHASPKVLKWAAKYNTTIGMRFSHDQLKRCTLKLCDSCQIGRMRRFPSPMSMHQHAYQPGECYSIDDIPMGQVSCRGYKGWILMVDAATDKAFAYLTKTNNAPEFVEKIKLHFQLHHGGQHPRVIKCNTILTDNGPRMTSDLFKNYCKEPAINIILHYSAPYQQVQNRTERFVQTLKGGIKSCMAYNNAPYWYWCYCVIYYIITYNSLPKYGRPLSRDEDFTGVKPDMSMATPFYAKGVYQITPAERQLFDGGESWADKARIVRFLGYAKGDTITFKNSFDVLIGTKSNRPQIRVRHDCYFRSYQNGPDVLSLNENDRYVNTYTPEQTHNYDLLFGDLSKIDNLPEPAPDHDNEQFSDVGDDSNDDDLPPVYRKKKRTPQPFIAPLPIPPPVEEDEPYQAAYKSHADKLEQNLVNLEVPWTEDDDVPSSSHQRNQLIDPRYRQILETHHYIRANKLKKPEQPINAAPTSGYNLRARVNNKVYRQTPKVAAYLVQLTDEMKSLLPDGMNPPPPIFIHVSRAPQGDTEPKSLWIALQGPDRDEWWIGWQTEKERLGVRGSWEDVPPDQQNDKTIPAINSTFACRCTQRADGTWKYRVRLCARGDSQVYGRDYWETFAPTAKFKSFTILMQLAAINDWEIRGLDIENAFLEADLDEKIHMYIPIDPSIKNSPKMKVLLKKTLYGLKQAGERFFARMVASLIKKGFTQTAHDICVFTKINPKTGKETIVLLYVDDIIVTGSDTEGIYNTIEYLATQVEKITDLGELSRFIGIDIKRDRVNRTIILTQQPYITKIQEDDPIDKGRDDVCPLDSTLDYRQSGDNTKSLEKEVGQLRYAADKTRPDIQIAASLLGAHSRDPHDVHIRGAKRTKRYLRGTSSKGLIFHGTTNQLNLFGMCDGSYIPYADSKSQLGYAIFLNLESGTIQARSHKDNLVSHSSFEIEIKALDELIRALVWVKGFLTEVGYDQTDIPTPIYIDNEAAILIGNTYKLTENNSHMVRNLNYIHQEVKAHRITLRYIDTNNNVADVLTKALPQGPFIQHTKTLLEGFDNIPIVPVKTKTQQRLEGIPVTLKTKRPLESSDSSQKRKK